MKKQVRITKEVWCTFDKDGGFAPMLGRDFMDPKLKRELEKTGLEVKRVKAVITVEIEEESSTVQSDGLAIHYPYGPS